MANFQRGTGAFVACVVVALYCAMGWTKSEREDGPSRTWRPDYLGLSLEAPLGWSELRPGGAWCLVRDPADPLAGCVRVEVEADLYHCEPEQSLRDLRETFVLDRTRALDRWDESEAGGLRLARVAWHGTPAGAAAAVRGELVACDRGESRVRVEAIARGDAWPAIERDVEQLFGSLVIERR